MRAKPTNRPRPADSIAAIPSCALDDTGRVEQHARYARLASTVCRVDRGLARLVVQFDERLDRDLLERTLAVERDCCPFFVFSFDDQADRLEIAVRTADQRPALAAIAAAFDVVPRARSRSDGNSR